MKDNQTTGVGEQLGLSVQSELFFKTYLHSTLPLHAALVDALCRRPRLPMDLATVLEDIGQSYVDLAERMNREIARRRDDSLEDEPVEADEAHLEAVINALIDGIGTVDFQSGSRIDGSRALKAFPAVADAIRTALLLEQAAETARNPTSHPAPSNE